MADKAASIASSTYEAAKDTLMPDINPDQKAFKEEIDLAQEMKAKGSSYAEYLLERAKREQRRNTTETKEM